MACFDAWMGRRFPWQSGLLDGTRIAPLANPPFASGATADVAQECLTLGPGPAERWKPFWEKVAALVQPVADRPDCSAQADCRQAIRAPPAWRIFLPGGRCLIVSSPTNGRSMAQRYSHDRTGHGADRPQ